MGWVCSWEVFNPNEALFMIRSFDDTRLIDFDSGGGENPLYLGDVTDVHTYDPIPYHSPFTVTYIIAIYRY